MVLSPQPFRLVQSFLSYIIRILGPPLATGVGAMLNFTLFDNNTTWIPIFIGIASIGIVPVFSGWRSSNVAHMFLFPPSVVGGLAIAWAAGAPLSPDANSIAFIIYVGLLYGGIASVAYIAASTLHRYFHRARA